MNREHLHDAHARDITLKVQELVRHGLLELSGRTRNTTYTPRQRPELPVFAERAASSPRSAPSSPHTAESSPHSAASSPHKDLVVERVRTSRRAPPEAVRAAILALCEADFVTVGDLAASLRREAVTIQQNYVSRMLDEGLLEARYPETPNHPGLAYRARRPAEGAEP